MRRLCIYVTYPPNKHIKEYIGIALKALKQYGMDIFFVCNCLESVSGLKYVEPYVNQIFYRKNIGWDSGAFKDALFDFIGWNRVLNYDELILINDSFFVFSSLDAVFKQMAAVDCDYWGMTRHPGGEISNPRYEFSEHIQSYFLVFRNMLLHSDAFVKFWKQLQYPNTYREAVINYEIQLNAYLRDNGYKAAAVMDSWHTELTRNVDPSMKYPYELIAELNIPILKRKCLLVGNPGFPNAIKAIQYLQVKELYPIELIEEFMENQFYNSKFGQQEYSCNSLEFFYRQYTSIYIYGHGVCGKNLAVYFEYKHWRFEKFLVTDIEGGSNVMTFEEAVIKPTTGIIIAVLDQKASEEIAMHIGTRCCREQLFFISECTLI